LGPCKTCWNNNASGAGPRRARDFAGDRLGAASARGVAGDRHHVLEGGDLLVDVCAVALHQAVAVASGTQTVRRARLAN